ncbi:MAG: helix-turn-helix transcriptional regulator [Bacteroidetes bacterium]|nr:helix-turn-helix transcriptional regulator [Bacteroidota bacterium]
MTPQDAFNRIIESLQVKYYRAAIREVLKPVELNGSIEPRNILVQVKSGSFYGERDFTKIEKGCFYFMPVGSPIYFRHGKSAKYPAFGKEGFASPELREQYVKSRLLKEGYDDARDIFTIAGFDVHIYGAIPFFSILELPCFVIPYDEEMSYLMEALVSEEENKRLGRERLQRNLAEELVVHICRYISNKPQYEKNFEKINYLLDKRLVNIIQYIQSNLGGDLSNQTIAQLAYVSKDYIGQFFKTMTNANLQDYIENQRLEKAHYLLRTTKDNVQEIAHNIGFKDPAYFSRRFKMKFNKNANQIRKESIITI